MEGARGQAVLVANRGGCTIASAPARWTRRPVTRHMSSESRTHGIECAEWPEQSAERRSVLPLRRRAVHVSPSSGVALSAPTRTHATDVPPRSACTPCATVAPHASGTMGVVGDKQTGSPADYYGKHRF